MAERLNEIQRTEQSMQPYPGPPPKRGRGRPRKSTSAFEVGPDKRDLRALVLCYACQTMFEPKDFRFLKLTRNLQTHVWSAHVCHHCARAIVDMVSTLVARRQTMIAEERAKDLACKADLPGYRGEPGAASPDDRKLPEELSKTSKRADAAKKAWRARKRKASLLAGKRPVGRPRKTR